MSTPAMQGAVSATEGMFRVLVEQSLAGISVITEEGKFAYVNPRLAEMFGYTPDEILSSKSPADLAAEEDRATVAENIRRRLEGEAENPRYAFRGLRRDGTGFDVEVHGTRANFQGRPAIIGVALDITGRTLAEEAPPRAHGDLERYVRERTADLSSTSAGLRGEIAERRSAGEALGKATEMLGALIQASPLAIIVLDPDLTVRTWNPAAERIFGWTAGEVIGRPYPLVPEDRREEFRKRYAMVERGEAFSEFETRRRRKDGAEAAVSISVAPLFDSGGALRAIVTFFADIRERKRAEAERERATEMLRRLQAVTDVALTHLNIQELPGELLRRIRSALDADTASVLLLDEHGDHLVVIASDGLREDIEQGARIPVGRGFAGAVVAARTPLHVDDASQSELLSPFLRAQVRSLLGAPMVLEDRVIGLVVVGTAASRRFSGHDAEMLQLVADRLALVIQQGRLYARERQARAAAEAAEQRAAFLAEASRLLASSLNYKTTLNRIARLAVPQLADWCAVDMLEKDQSLRMAAVVHADSAKEALVWEIRRRYPPRADDPVPRALQTGRAQIIADISDALLAARAQDADHLRLLQELGMRSYMIVPLIAHRRTLGAIVFVSAESGRRYGLPDLVLAKDLARRAALALDNARLYREAQEADRRKDEFLSMLAHELRNPLAPILNATQVLEKIGSGEPLAVEMRAIIRRQGYHLARLVDGLLDVARLRTGRIALQRRSVDLREVAERSLEALRAAGKAAGKEVSLSLAGERVIVEGDPTRLEQVVENLLDNAAKYSPPGGPIALVVERGGGEAVIRVQDRGVGIAPEMLPRIFDPFQQAQKSLDRPNGGLGLGLSMVRSLVELQGGKVAAQSPGPGQGSEFVMRLPLAGGPQAPAQGDDAASPPPPCHILIVEDNRDSREALRALLESAGHRVAVAADGREGIDLAIALQPEIALIDLGLPVLNGYEVAQKLRSTPEGQRISLVALTGYGQPQDSQHVFAAGFDAHLVKPVPAGDLWRAIASLPRASSSPR